MSESRLLLLATLYVASAAAGSPALLENTFDGGKFGVMHTYRPALAPTSVALFFSGDGGWGAGASDMARRLASEGFLVGGIDTTRYIAAIRPKSTAPGAKSSCVYMAADVEALSQHFQRSLGLPNYLRPVLFGHSAGASLVYATLAQAPRGTFAGGVSLSFCAEMDTANARLCPGEGLRTAPIPKQPAPGTDVLLQPDAKFAFPWTVVHGDRDTICSAAQTRSFVTAIPSARLIALPNAAHDLAPADAWWPQVRNDYRAMLIADTASPATSATSAPPPASTDSLADLPITEVPATGGDSDAFAVMISGDGGWAGLDQDLSATLSGRGIAVAGLNSLKYFWKARTPEQTAADVARMIEHYGSLWHKQRVLLVGYSFGADVMPFVVNRLSAATRARVASVSFLGLGPAATFEVTVGEWLPGANLKGSPVVPEVTRMQALPMLCVVGAGEKDSSCPQLQTLGVTVRQIGDGHHFSGLAVQIADAIEQVAALSPKNH